jgi:hypothetical protein
MVPLPAYTRTSVTFFFFEVVGKKTFLETAVSFYHQPWFALQTQLHFILGPEGSPLLHCDGVQFV